jgi:hypothetical protein
LLQRLPAWVTTHWFAANQGSLPALYGCILGELAAEMVYLLHLVFTHHALHAGSLPPQSEAAARSAEPVCCTEHPPWWSAPPQRQLLEMDVA